MGVKPTAEETKTGGVELLERCLGDLLAGRDENHREV